MAEDQDIDIIIEEDDELEATADESGTELVVPCLLYTSPSPRD